MVNIKNVGVGRKYFVQFVNEQEYLAARIKLYGADSHLIYVSDFHRWSLNKSGIYFVSYLNQYGEYSGHYKDKIAFGELSEIFCYRIKYMRECEEINIGNYSILILGNKIGE